jgi:heat shock protein HslJ
MKFNAKRNRLNGYAGSNNFFDTYEIKDNYRFQFSKISSTMMACAKMKPERDFFNYLKRQTNIIKDHKLQLTRARMAPPAVFERVAGKYCT